LLLAGDILVGVEHDDFDSEEFEDAEQQLATETAAGLS
jgi:hypothetical protein